MTSFEAMLAGASLPSTSVALSVAGALQAEWEELERELAALDEARDTANSFPGGESAAAREGLVEQLAKIRAEMQAHEHIVTLRALPRRQWSDLVAEHPPREDNAQDEAVGLNNDTWPSAIISACAIDPPMTVEQVDQLGDVLTDAQISKLYQAAMILNRMDVGVPKFGIGYDALRSTAPKSPPPAPGVSAADGSSAGNPPA
ncbi:hypothetical protein [Actinomadura litoris]|uniref:hypothetical protein n=1 Tax=Actinomadura litoris TaxID=2678616 RepID=UPI001FA71B31|nr:hypothetical protein [Actinomadura litoris]